MKDLFQIQKRKRSRLARYSVRLAIQVPLFLLLYVASIGPLYWYWYEAQYLNGSPLITKFYFPLLKACESVEWIRFFVNKYIDWWIL